MTKVCRSPYSELSKLVNVEEQSAMAAIVSTQRSFLTVEEDPLADFDKFVGITDAPTSFETLEWQDMNRRHAESSSSSSRVTPQRTGSCDEYEASLLHSDAFTVEDQAASLVDGDEVKANLDTTDETPLDASFFTKFAMNITTEEEAFGIDGTGAGVGVGASYYESAWTSVGVVEEEGNGADLNSRGVPRRKRKASRARSDSDFDASFVPIIAGGAGVRKLLSTVGSSSSSSFAKRSEGATSGAEAGEEFEFPHDGRGDGKGKRNTRGKYKCSRCGEQKNNHICSVLTDTELTVSTGTQCNPLGFSLLTLDALAAGAEVPLPSSVRTTSTVAAINSFTEVERVLTVRPWKQ
jgi:hypothetical protein